MNQLPDFWRTEIWHPLSVHLPLAALLLATLFGFISLLLKGINWKLFSYILLFIGTVGAWVSIFTGNLADGIVSRTICDPTILKDHQNAAYTVAWLFTAASFFAIVDLTDFLKKLKIIIKIIILILMLSGSGFLAYTGHLGATLVYQQAAGVYTPSEDCIEFSDSDN